MSEATGGRSRRIVAEGDRRWLAFEAWRAASGHGLVYLVRLEDDEPAPGDREDRRAALEPGRELAALDVAELRELLSGAVPLTPTERRLIDADGEVWLVQAEGPVWAEGEVAGGLTGLVFSRLSGAPERRTLGGGGGGVARLADEELLARLERGGRVGEPGAGRRSRRERSGSSGPAGAPG